MKSTRLTYSRCKHTFFSSLSLVFFLSLPLLQLLASFLFIITYIFMIWLHSFLHYSYFFPIYFPSIRPFLAYCIFIIAFIFIIWLHSFFHYSSLFPICILSAFSFLRPYFPLPFTLRTPSSFPSSWHYTTICIHCCTNALMIQPVTFLWLNPAIVPRDSP